MEQIDGRAKNRWQWAVFLLLIAVFLFFQSSRLSAQPWDVLGAWRQTDTYSMARNFVHFNMNPLMPQLNYDGAADNYAQLELQIMPWISAVIFKLTGVMTPVVCRVLSLVFFLGSSLYLYLLARDFLGVIPALFCHGVYLFIPLSMLMASYIQPEACCLFFFCGGVYYLRRYQVTAKNRYLAGASLMTAVAIMEKTPAAFVGLVFLYALFSVMGKTFYKNPWFYGCAVMTLAPPALLILYTSRHSVFRFVDGIATKHIMSSRILSLFTKKGLEFFRMSFTNYFGMAVVVMAVIGILLLTKKEYRFLLFWTIAFLLECATIVAAIQFQYYLIFLLPVAAVLCGVTFKELWGARKRIAAAACVFMILSLATLGANLWKADHEVEIMAQTGQLIAETTDFNDAIAVGAQDPSYINVADRRGYRANLKYYADIPTAPAEEVAYFIEHGVRWFVVRAGYIDGDDGSYLAYVRENFPVHAANDYCVIFDLGSGEAS